MMMTMRRIFIILLGIGVLALFIYWSSTSPSISSVKSKDQQQYHENHSNDKFASQIRRLSLKLLQELESNGSSRIELNMFSFIGFNSTDEIGEVVDEFLTPRPKWRLLSEPYPSSPFQKIVLEKFVKEGSKLAELYDELVKLQYPQSCDSIADDNFEVHGLLDHGFSSVLIGPVNSLMWYLEKFIRSSLKRTKLNNIKLIRSILNNKTMVLTRGCFVIPKIIGCDNGNQYWAWSDNSKCPRAGIDAWSCNFLPMTSCKAPHSRYDYVNFRLTNPSPRRQSFDTDPKWKGAWKKDGDPHCSWMDHDLFWWRSHLSFFALRPNYHIRKNLVFPGEKCVAMHVRHGDSSADMREKEYNVSKVASLENFVKFTRPYLEKAQTNNVFLFTDDGNVLNETKNYADINWVTIKKPMFSGWGPEHVQHFASGDKELEMATMLMTWMTAARCETIIASISEFSNMALMYAQQTHCPNYVSPLKSNLYWHPAF